MNFYFAVLLEPENFIQKDEKKNLELIWDIF